MTQFYPDRYDEEDTTVINEELPSGTKLDMIVFEALGLLTMLAALDAAADGFVGLGILYFIMSVPPVAASYSNLSRLLKQGDSQ
jgi:hypothetical protein